MQLNCIIVMNRNDIKKEREFQCILPIMKELGYDEQVARKLITDSEKPDFLFRCENKMVGIEVTECDPESQNKKGAQNLRVAMKRTTEICKFIEESEDARNNVVNYRLGFNFSLLFDLQRYDLRRPEKEKIQEKVYMEMRERISNSDYIDIEDDYQKLHKEWTKPYHYIRDIVIDKPLDNSIVSYSYPVRGAITIEQEAVIKAILGKEKKISSYQKEHPDIKEYWLCVNIPIGSNRTLYGFEMLPFGTTFDRVYLTEHTFVRLK